MHQSRLHTRGLAEAILLPGWYPRLTLKESCLGWQWDCSPGTFWTGSDCFANER